MKAIVRVGLSWTGYYRPQGPKLQHELDQDMRLVRDILHKAGFETLFSPTQPFYNLEVEKGDARLNRLIEELQVRPDLASPHITVERQYALQELEAASLLILYITNQSIKDDHYAMYPKRDRRGVGLPYRECSACRAPLEQVRDLFLNPHHMGKKDVSLTYAFDVILSERMASMLHEQSVSGFDLRPVQNYGAQGAGTPQLYQLQITSKLPPMLAPPTEFDLIHQCPICGSRSHFLKRTHQWEKIQYYEDTDVYYPETVTEVVQDFNHTAEWFGELPVMKPMNIISQRLFRLLRDAGIKHWKAVPVQLV